MANYFSHRTLLHNDTPYMMNIYQGAPIILFLYDVYRGVRYFKTNDLVQISTLGTDTKVKTS